MYASLHISALVHHHRQSLGVVTCDESNVTVRVLRLGEELTAGIEKQSGMCEGNAERKSPLRVAIA